MSHALGACLDAALETARAEARACLERSLDVADASIRSAWGREISGSLPLGSSERAELEATNASLTERVADLEARCASLADQLRGAELAAARLWLYQDGYARACRAGALQHKEPDGPGAEHDDRVAQPDLGAPNRMHGDRRGLQHGRVCVVQSPIDVIDAAGVDGDR